jgi:hypothetical protein
MVKYTISNKTAIIILLYFQVFLLKLNHAKAAYFKECAC